ncbi:hypothetical protein AG0111_0g12085 [Alternaria gaisen]|uniref:Uncharacterized protein n=1 Tax=Alternaria gaisen TaxID=167740 RepID=A0ACB6F5J3_9PLEO|nr:hypothetical protein AG0111_0g12085 [Alternaria gaisen]
MNIDKLLDKSLGGNQARTTGLSPYLQSPAYNNTPPAHATTSVRDGLVLPTIYKQLDTEQLYVGQPAPQPVAMEVGINGVQMTTRSKFETMTIKDHQGRCFDIPVEVAAGSRVVDDKRKRNAGASSRFRARRKEKIARQEQELCEAREKLEHYRTERDYFRSIVLQQPGAEQHHARPPTPQPRRPPSNAPSSEAGAGSPYSPLSPSISSNS